MLAFLCNILNHINLSSIGIIKDEGVGKVKVLLLGFFLNLIYVQVLACQIEEGEHLWGISRSSQDGLSQNIPLSIKEDKCGLIWIGTMDGLNVYDGQEFRDVTRYQKNLANNNSFFEIYIDQDTTIWARKNQGIYHFSLKKKKWSESSLFSQFKGLLVLPSGKKIAVFGEHELALMKGVEGYELLPNVCPLESPFVQPILRYDEATGLLYIMKKNGQLIIYNFAERKCVAKLKIGNDSKIQIEDFELSDDFIWAHSRNQFFKIDKNNLNVKELTRDFECVDKFAFCDLHYNKRTHNLWLAANSAGVYRYNEETEKWTHHHVKALSRPQFENDLIITVFESKDGTLYLGSVFNAMIIIKKEQSYFNNIPEFVAQEGFVKDLRYPNKIMFGKKGDLWIGTASKGLWRYKFDESQILNYSKSNQINNFLRSDSIASYTIHNEKLYIAYHAGYLGIYDYKTLNEIEYLDLNNQFEEGNWVINDMVIGSTGSIFLVTNKGLIKIANSRIEQVYENEIEKKSFDNIIRIIRYDNKFIMFSLDCRIYEFDMDATVITEIETNLPKGSALMKCLMIDTDNNHWIGTSEKGILLFDSSWNLIRDFNVKNSILKSNEISNVIQDLEGNVWVGTDLGLCYFEKSDDGRFEANRLFTKESGLLSSKFLVSSHLVQGDTLWMGNIEGVNYWIPKIINKNKSQLPIYVTSVLANKEEIYTDIFESKEIKIEQNANNLQFRFRTIGFINRGKMKYRTKLRGYDKKWSPASDEAFVSYNNLPAGKYELNIQSKHFDGSWSTNTFRLPFQITKPFYRTFGFYTFLVLLSLLFIYLLCNEIIKRRTSRLQRTMQMEIELAEMEIQSLHSQINQHFLFNTLSSINNFLLKNEKNIASFYLVKFAKLIRRILQYTRKESIILRDEIETNELYIEIEQMRLGESFDYFVNIKMDDLYDELILPPLILQPFIENAIWHGLTHKKGDKILTITVEVKKEILLIKIEDNGIGRKRANEINNTVQRKSHGIDITKKRLDLWAKRHNRNFANAGFFKIIDVDTEVNITGTIVEIYLPVIHKNETF